MFLIKIFRLSFLLKCFLGAFLFFSWATILKIGIASVYDTHKNITATKLGDGCYHVFLDVGANIGMHGRFVLEPRNFKEKRGNMTFDEHSQMMFFFDEQFGKERGIDSKGSKNGNICVFAFEPNPKHQERHLHMQNVYSKFGLRYHPIFKGVSDQDGTMTFFHQDQGKNNEWGFSVVKRYPRKKLAKINNVTTTEVEIIRLSKWLEKHILHRQIPDFEINPKIKAKVVMKMDVEGMEYILWPDLFFQEYYVKL